jgi:hypothetical protein
MNGIERAARRGSRAVMVVALMAVVAAGTSAEAGSAVKLKSSLAATAAAPGASGEVRFAVRGGDDARFRIIVRGLTAGASYDVLADDVRVGTIDTTRHGTGRLRLSSRARGDQHLLGFDPRGGEIRVRGADGADVLVVSIDDSSSPPAGDVVCCVPDDGGTECEDRTASECAARGGTVSDATSCLPNPCAGAPSPGVDIVCCIPDDSGAECEDRTVEQCVAQGGTVIDASSCIGNPCAGAPSPQPTVTTTPDGTRTPGASRTPAPSRTPGASASPDASRTPSGGSTPDDDAGDDHGGHGGGGGGHGRGGNDD